MPSITDFTQFGIAGAILFVLVFVIYIHSKSFQQMSKEWRESFEAQTKRADDRQSETNDILRGLTKVIAEK
jgi:hypothetical protein